MEKLARWTAPVVLAGFYALMAVGTWLMVSSSMSYLELGEAHPFYFEKLPLAHPRLWLTALYVHVPSALFALPACLVLTLRSTSRRFPRAHRWLGRVTGALVLCAVVPSGMYLALFAQGGMMTTLGFWLTGGITFVAMVLSIRAARVRKLLAHRRFSAHVTAQLSVAVLSRVLLVAAETGGSYSTWVYVAALWLPVLGCAVVAELVTGAPFRKGLRHEKVARAAHVHAVR
jgi:hypothetical protein